MLGGLILHGIRPGPLIFQQFSISVYTVMFGALFANIAILISSPILIRYFVKLLEVPQGILVPVILILSIGGSYATRNNLMDVWTLFIFGIIGFVLEEYKFPLAPMVMGLVLGELAERNLRRSLVISGGDASIFFTRPISGVLMVLTIVIVLLPIIGRIRKSLS